MHELRSFCTSFFMFHILENKFVLFCGSVATHDNATILCGSVLSNCKFVLSKFVLSQLQFLQSVQKHVRHQYFVNLHIWNSDSGNYFMGFPIYSCWDSQPLSATWFHIIVTQSRAVHRFTPFVQSSRTFYVKCKNVLFSFHQQLPLVMRLFIINKHSHLLTVKGS